MTDATQNPDISSFVDGFLPTKPAPVGRKSFVASVEAFIEACDWLTDADLPAVTSLQALAEELDSKVTASLIGQYGVVYRDLLKRGNPTAEPTDPLEAALQNRGQTP